MGESTNVGGWCDAVRERDARDGLEARRRVHIRNDDGK